MSEQEIPQGHEDTVSAHKQLRGDFTDYPRFEDSNVENRLEARKKFLDNDGYVPKYVYPKLRLFKDDAEVVTKKTDIYQAVLDLEQARRAALIVQDEARAAELSLYRDFHDYRLKKVFLVEAAQHLHAATSSSALETAREGFLQLNEEVYGEVDAKLYQSMLQGEKTKLDHFQPRNPLAERVYTELGIFFDKLAVGPEEQKPLLEKEEIQAVQELIATRYADVIGAVPETDDTVYYDAEESAAIINLALEAGGLAEHGWICVVDKAKSNPTTNGQAKKISLPSTTRRNARELTRLILHEQEVHARRSQNGKETGISLLGSGTANYADVEEGLGVLLECAYEGNFSNPSFNRAKERYLTAGLAQGLDAGGPRDAREVYEVLWRMIAVGGSSSGELSDAAIDAAKNKAYAHIENAFRGTGFWMKGVIYTKLKVYYEGLSKNADFVRANIDRLDEAFDLAMIGKFNHTDPSEVGLIKTLATPEKNT